MVYQPNGRNNAYVWLNKTSSFKVIIKQEQIYQGYTIIHQNKKKMKNFLKTDKYNKDNHYSNRIQGPSGQKC